MPNNIPETYASPGLRWGLFLHDHPHAPDPVFRLARWDDPDVNVPEEFAKGGSEEFTGEFVVCTIDPADGGEKITAWREIPGKEKRGGSWQTVSKTPDNWRKLTTMALGRALKQAGYADDTSDLKALLLWRRRDVEMRMLEAGLSPPPALGAAPDEKDLDAAAKPTPHAEHPDTAAVAGEDGTEPDEVVVDAGDQWSADASGLLRPLVDRLKPDQRAQLQAWADTKNWGPIQLLSAGPAMRGVIARARGMLGKDAPVAPAEATSPAPGPPSDQPAQSGAKTRNTRQAAGGPPDPNAKAPMPMTRSVLNALEKLVDPESPLADGDLAEQVFAAAPFLDDNGWQSEGLTYGQIAEAWDALRAVGIDG